MRELTTMRADLLQVRPSRPHRAPKRAWRRSRQAMLAALLIGCSFVAGVGLLAAIQHLEAQGWTRAK